MCVCVFFDVHMNSVLVRARYTVRDIHPHARHRPARGRRPPDARRDVGGGRRRRTTDVGGEVVIRAHARDVYAYHDSARAIGTLGEDGREFNAARVIHITSIGRARGDWVHLASGVVDDDDWA